MFSSTSLHPALHRLTLLSLFLVIFQAGNLCAAPLKKRPPSDKSPDSVIELALGHSLGKVNASRLQVLVDRFNQQDRNHRFKLVFLEEGDKPVHLNLATPSTVSRFVLRQQLFMPLAQVMKDAGQPIDYKQLSTDLLVPEMGQSKQLVALPIAFSTPVLFYDRAAFRRVGFNPDQPPATWQDLQKIAGKLTEVGHPCPYTTSWQTWIHVDNTSALAGEPVANKEKGLVFNALPQVRHIARLAAWSKAGLFKVFGNRDEADFRFAKRECAMLTSNAWIHSWLSEEPDLELGIAPLPHDEDAYGGRRHTLVDGSSLWAGGAFSKKEYQGVAKFISFLLAPDIQIELSRIGHFIPFSRIANDAVHSRLFRDDPVLQVVETSLQNKKTNPAIRVGSIQPLKEIVDEELNAVWANTKPAKAALDEAVARGNVLLNKQPKLKNWGL